MAVPTYYASLSLQALLRIRNNFNESAYLWIEKYIHIVAWSIPCILSIIYISTEYFNPSISRCWITGAPPGCEADPNVPCQRGKGDIGNFTTIVGLVYYLIIFILPPSIIIFMYCRIRKIKNCIERSWGMQRIRGSAQKKMMHSIIKQMSLYLFSFWITWLTGLADQVYRQITGERIYWLATLEDCLLALQGFLLAVVYFTLQRMGKPKVISLPVATPRPGPRGRQLTVQDIRDSVRLSSLNNLQSTVEVGSDGDERRESYVFNIFDGAPDETSPWARFIDGDEDEAKEEEAKDSTLSEADDYHDNPP